MAKDTNGQKKGRRVGRWILRGAGAILLVGLVTAMVKIDLWHVHFGYAQAAKRYKAAGMPWTAKELAVSDIPEENSLTKKLNELYQKHPQDSNDEVRLPQGLLTKETAKDLEQSLASRNPLLEDSRDLEDLEYKWNPSWQQTSALVLEFPELARIKELVKLLGYRLELRSFRGEIKASVEDLHLAISLSQKAGSSGDLVGFLVEAATRSIILMQTRRAASYHLDDPEALEAFASALQRLEKEPDLAASLRFEALTSLQMMRNIGTLELMFPKDPLEALAEDETEKPKKLPILDGDPKSLLSRSFSVPLLEAWAEAGETLKAKGESSEVVAEVCQRLKEKAEAMTGVSASFAKFQLPVYQKGSIAQRKTSADYLSTLAALKIAAIKAGKGSVSQPQVTALLPLDPFTKGVAMKSEVRDGVIKVWSVAEDGSDDGGFSMSDAAFMRANRPARTSQPATFDYVAELPWRLSYQAQERLKKKHAPGAKNQTPSGFAMPDNLPEAR